MPKSDKKANESNDCVPENVFGVRENTEVRSKCAQSALKWELSAQEKIIVNYIVDKGKITSSELMTLIGIKKRRAQIILGKLVNEGILRKEGASKNTSYVFNDALLIKEKEGY